MDSFMVGVSRTEWAVSGKGSIYGVGVALEFRTVINWERMVL